MLQLQLKLGMQWVKGSNLLFEHYMIFFWGGLVLSLYVLYLGLTLLESVKFTWYKY